MHVFVSVSCCSPGWQPIDTEEVFSAVTEKVFLVFRFVKSACSSSLEREELPMMRSSLEFCALLVTKSN